MGSKFTTLSIEIIAVKKYFGSSFYALLLPFMINHFQVNLLNRIVSLSVNTSNPLD